MQRPPDPQLLGFLEAYDRHISDLALALREMILEEAPDASESIYQVYTVAIWFGFSGKMKDMFCYIATNAGHVNLGIPARRARCPIRIGCWKATARPCATSSSGASAMWSAPSCGATSRRRWSRSARLGVSGTGKSVVKTERGDSSKRRAKTAKQISCVYTN